MYKSREDFIRLIRSSLFLFLLILSIVESACGETIVGAIYVRGNSEVTSEAILAQIKLTEGNVFRSYIFYNDIDKIKDYYTQSGFPEALITGSYQARDDKIDVLIEITENKPEIIRSLETTTDVAAELSEKYLNKRWTKKINDTLVIELTRHYQNRGFLKPVIKVEKSMTGDHDVMLSINEETGPEYYFGEIYCIGLETIQVNYVTREATFSKGELFDMRKINKYQETLYSLGVFEDINMKIIDVGERVNIIVEIKEGEFKWIGVDFGYTSPAVGRIGFEWGSYNLWNRLHRLTLKNSNEIDFEGNNYLTSFDMTYLSRWFFKWKLNIGFITSLKNEKEDEGLNNEISFRTFIKKDISQGNYIMAGYEKKLDYYSELYDESVELELNQWLITNRIFTGLYYDNLDNKIHPAESGFSFSANAELNGSFMEGDFTYLKLRVDGAYYKYLVRESTMAVLHGLYKKILPIGGVMNPPYDELFSLGGAFDLRGYRYEELGDDYYTIFSGNVELRQRLKGLFWGALFVDGGCGGENGDRLNIDRFHGSFGAGLRYMLPFIIIRLDYGVRSFTEEGTLHLVLGHIF